MKNESGSWYLSSVPYIFDKPANAAFLTDMLDMIHTEKLANVYDSKLMSIATMACKAAVKAGDKISVGEAEEMVEKLLSLKNPFSCPHGRPTIIEMTEYELEKKFKRIQ
ncbi:DNA mismatch repair protein MutL [bioreactor metagenome]|uniref:DNA mismatch repair protein MutL n=1 Tax=bioreactor metagenome TaxID=1076179 RepID=A0A645I9Y0_9ZZZZ